MIIALFNFSCNKIQKNIYIKEWEDEILKWDPSEYDNITMIRVPVQKPWTPGKDTFQKYLF